MNLSVIAGAANPELAEAVVQRLGLKLAARTLQRFPDTELQTEIGKPVRGDDVYLLQPTSPDVDHHLMELLLLADACRRAGAARISAVVPYFGYARQDRRASGREPVGARLIADLLKTAGIDRVVAVDLHSAGLEGFFSMPLEHLSAVPLLADAIAPQIAADTVIISPDLGAVKLAEQYARLLDRPVVVAHKVRITGEKVETRGLIGDVRGRPALVIDDMISTGATIEAAVNAFVDQGGLPEVIVAATHGLFVGAAAARLGRLSPKCIFITDSIAAAKDLALPIQALSLAPLLAETIERLHNDQSLRNLIGHR